MNISEHYLQKNLHNSVCKRVIDFFFEENSIMNIMIIEINDLKKEIVEKFIQTKEFKNVSLSSGIIRVPNKKNFLVTYDIRECKIKDIKISEGNICHIYIIRDENTNIGIHIEEVDNA